MAITFSLMMVAGLVSAGLLYGGPRGMYLTLGACFLAGGPLRWSLYNLGQAWAALSRGDRARAKKSAALGLLFLALTVWVGWWAYGVVVGR